MKFDVALLLTSIHLISLAAAAPLPRYSPIREESGNLLGSLEGRNPVPVSDLDNGTTLLVRRTVDFQESGSRTSSSNKSGEENGALLNTRGSGLSYGAKGLLALGAGFLATWAWGREGDRVAAENKVRNFFGRPIQSYNNKQTDDLMRSDRWNPMSTLNPFVPYKPAPFTGMDPRPA